MELKPVGLELIGAWYGVVTAYIGLVGDGAEAVEL